MRRQPLVSSRGRSCSRERLADRDGVIKTVNWFRRQHNLLLQKKLNDNKIRQRVEADVVAALNLSDLTASPAMSSKAPLRHMGLSSCTSDSQLPKAAPAMLTSSSTGSVRVPGTHSAERATRRRNMLADSNTIAQVGSARIPPSPTTKSSTAPKMETADPPKSSSTLDEPLSQRPRSSSREKYRAAGFGFGSRALPWAPREASPVRKSGDSDNEARRPVPAGGRSRSPTGRRPKAKAALAAVVRRSMTGQADAHSIVPPSNKGGAKLMDGSDPHLHDAEKELAVQQAASALRRMISGQPHDEPSLKVRKPKSPKPGDKNTSRQRAHSPFREHDRARQDRMISARPQSSTCSVDESPMYSDRLCVDSPELDSVSSYVPWLDEGRSAALQDENAALRKELARANEQGEELERLRHLAEERRLELEKEKYRLLSTFEVHKASPRVGIGILSLEEQNQTLRDELSEATRKRTEGVSSAQRQLLEEHLRGVEERCRVLEVENARLQREGPVSAEHALTMASGYEKPSTTSNSLHELLVMTERAGRQMNEVLQRNSHLLQSYECALSSAGA